MPFPTTSVFHPRWAEHTRPTNEDSFNTVVTVTIPGPEEGGWDPVTGPTPPGAPVTLYTGPARVTYAPTQGAEGDAVAQEISSRRAQVTIPRDQTTPDNAAFNGGRIHVDAVTDPNAPAALAGRVLFIETASWSSHTWELLLDATDDQTNQGG